MEEHGLTTSEALHVAFDELTGSGVPHARDEAEFILMHVLGCKRSELFLNARRLLTKEELGVLRGVLDRRGRREPAQYIFGEAEFRGLVFRVTGDVLIPRPETEILVGEAIKEGASVPHRPLKVVDLCAGSGCIGISVALEVAGSEVFAADISEAAVLVARDNARRLGATGSISFFTGDLLAPIPDGLRGRVDIILSNPPYITESDMERLDPEVRVHEPVGALCGGPDGMDIIRRILKDAPTYLRPGGLLLMEIGYDQKERVTEEALGLGVWDECVILKDYSGIGRIFKGRTST